MRYKRTDGNSKRQGDTYNNYGEIDTNQDKTSNMTEEQMKDIMEDHMEVTKDQITEAR